MLFRHPFYRLARVMLIAASLFAISGCAVHTTKTVETSAQQNQSSSDSLAGNWTRVGSPPSDFVVAIWLGLRFGNAGKLSVRYRPAAMYVGMLSRSRREALLKPRVETANYEEIGSGQVRIEMDGSASTYTFEIKGNKLYLTPPRSQFGSSETWVYVRGA